AGRRLAAAPAGGRRGEGDEGADQDALPDGAVHLPVDVRGRARPGAPQHHERAQVTPHETETGFGTGLRSLLERKGVQQAAVPEAVEDEVVLVDDFAPVPPPEVVEVELESEPVVDEPVVEGPPPAAVVDEAFEALRAELAEAIERERTAREEAHVACRAAAEREALVDAQVDDLERREETLRLRTHELEREQAALVERHTEIVSEYARVQELAAHAETRV